MGRVRRDGSGGDARRSKLFGRRMSQTSARKMENEKSRGYVAEFPQVIASSSIVRGCSVDIALFVELSR